MTDGGGLHDPTAPELPYLAAFRAVCAEGSFTAAAARLGCTQPAVSYQVRKLEDRLGARLLERGGRALVLTAEGRRVLRFADSTFAQLERVRADCRAGEHLEPLRLGSASGFGRYVLMPALRSLWQEASSTGGLELILEYDAADAILERLEAGSYDAAFVYKRLVTSALTYLPAYDEELVLVAAPPVAAEVRVAPLEAADSLARFSFVTYEECDYVFGRWFDASFGAQPQHVRSRARFTELEEVIDFVAAGVGLSVVPRDSAAAASERGEVEVLYAASGRRCWNTVYLVTRAGGEVRPRVRRLLELVEGARQR
ncbi:MAG TPA: LysR family transcriptional regulator [Longimicrobiales bacterium]|nr:LysR family transcriptional regulator [Longimicrobiales bacterium]